MTLKSIFYTVFALSSLSVSAISPDSEGWYTITSADDLREISTMVNAGSEALNVRLAGNIDLGGKAWTPIGNDTNRFSGVFDGNGYIISNMHVDVTGPAGLFGTVYTGEFHDVIIDSSCSVKGTKYAGGLIGHSYQGAVTISRVGVECDVTCSGEAAAGLIGNANAGSLCNIYNCYTSGHIKAKKDAAAFAGWLGNLKAQVKYCWTSSVVEGYQDKVHYLARYSSISLSNCESVNGTQGTKLDPADISSGALAWRLNSGNITGTWRQNIGSDAHPYPTGEHNYVYATENGFDSFGDEASYARFREYMLSFEHTFLNGVIAQKSLIDAYTAELDRIAAINDPADLIGALETLHGDRAAISTSAHTYGLYIDFCDEAARSIDGKTSTSEAFVRLKSYLTENTAPGVKFPRGSYPYIIATHTLGNEEVLDELEFARTMVRPVISETYSPGTDITALLDNADFTAGLNGWTITTDNSPVVSSFDALPTVVMTDNGAFGLTKTIEGLRNGYYMLTVIGATSAGSDVFNNLHTGFISLNGNRNYLQTLGEGAIATEEAVSGVNSLTTGNNKDRIYLNGDIVAYVPSCADGCAYAFSAGRYVNRVIGEVTDGTLTITISNDGLNGIPAWTAISAMKLTFMGNDDSDITNLDDATASYRERAETLLAYSPGIGDDSATHPGFSEDIRKQITDATGSLTGSSAAESLKAVKTLSDAFSSALESRAAYTAPDFDSASLRIMTYNIPYGNIKESDGNGLNTWSNRCNEICKYLQDVKPDLLGMQEPVRDELIDILKGLPGYAMAGEGRNGSDGGEYSPILYNASRIYIKEHDTFWLSDTPDVPSQLSNSQHKRISTWVLAEDKESGAQLLYFNTHLSYDSKEVRETQIRILKAHMADIRARFGEDIPVMLTGDFNMKDHEDNYGFVLHHKMAMRDLWATTADRADNCPDHNFGKIDYIYTSWNTCGSKVRWDYRNTPDGFWMSDHDPLWADIVFPVTLEDNIRAAIADGRELIEKTKTYTTVQTTLINSASQLSSDGYDKSLWGYESLIDGSTSTYMQTLTDGSAVNDIHYLQVETDRDFTDFFFKYNRRKGLPGTQDRWQDILITASQDGKEWHYIDEIHDFGDNGTNDKFSDNVALGKAYKYIRFNIVRTPQMTLRNGFPQFNVSEFQMYENTLSSDCPYLADAAVSTAAGDVERAIADAESAIASESATEAHLTDLRNAIEVLRNTDLTSVDAPVCKPSAGSREWTIDGRPYTGGTAVTVSEDGRKTLRK